MVREASRWGTRGGSTPSGSTMLRLWHGLFTVLYSRVAPWSSTTPWPMLRSLWCGCSTYSCWYDCWCCCRWGWSWCWCCGRGRTTTLGMCPGDALRGRSDMTGEPIGGMSLVQALMRFWFLSHSRLPRLGLRRGCMGVDSGVGRAARSRWCWSAFISIFPFGVILPLCIKGVRIASGRPSLACVSNRPVSLVTLFIDPRREWRWWLSFSLRPVRSMSRRRWSQTQ